MDTVVDKALCLLEDIDHATSGIKFESGVLYDTYQRRLVDALLDLILLEGIYPHLTPGVGVPIEQRVRSLLHTGFVASPQKAVPLIPGNLVSTVRRLSELAIDGSKSMSSEVLDRNLVDLVAVEAQLGFAPGNRGTNGQLATGNFDALIAR